MAESESKLFKVTVRNVLFCSVTVRFNMILVMQRLLPLVEVPQQLLAESGGTGPVSEFQSWEIKTTCSSAREKLKKSMNH